jgi:hypothetical protein
VSNFKVRFQRWYIGFARRIRILSILIIVLLVLYVAYQLYMMLSHKGVPVTPFATPNKTIESYFGALAQGDFDEVYRLTDKDTLTDIYGRQITQGEFASQLERLTGGRSLPLQVSAIEKLYSRKDVSYYEVRLSSQVGSTAGASRLLLEVHRTATGWLISYPFAIVLQG